MARTAKTFVLMSVVAVLAACSSINVQAPTGVERGQWDGAGAQ